MSEQGFTQVPEITPEEGLWIRTSDAPLARRLRFFVVLFVNWPFPNAPYSILTPLVAGMRWGRSSANDALPAERRAQIVDAGREVIHLPGAERLRKAARRLRVPLATFEAILAWEGVL